MQIFVSGFNGFNQWPLGVNIIENFRDINLCSYLQVTEAVKDFSCSIDWSYNAFNINGEVYLTGFIRDKCEKHVEKLTHPEGKKFTGMASNDKYLLLFNKDDSIVWKYNLFQENDEQQWQKLPDFLKIENSIANDDCEMKDISISDTEYICKIACGISMNICLTSNGRLFDIPSEIPTNSVEGRIVDVQCGYEHAVLLTDQGKVYTWGGGSRCQLGHGTINNVDHPKLVEALGGIDIVKIAAGGWHTCAISTFGDLYTWGWNDRGQLGIYSTKPSQNLTTQSRENEVDDSKKILYDNLFTDNEFFDPIASESTSCMKRTKSEENIANTTKKIKVDSSDTNDNISYNSFAIPQLIDIYDSSCNKIVEYNIIDVSCGSKHTVIFLDDGTVLGSGCNKFGQLGYNPNFRDTIEYFSPLSVRRPNKSVLKCGNWTTTLLVA